MSEYVPAIHFDEGGNRMVVKTGGVILVEAGGAITVDGDTYVVTEPDDETIEVDESDKLTLTDTVKGLLAILSDLPTENVAAPAVWNDSGVLKVGTLGD